VQAVRPGLAISFAAYFEPTKPPEGLVFEKNVEVDFCPITRSYEARLHDPGHAVNRAYYDLLNAWFETPALRGPLSLYTYYRKYAWRSLPILLPALIADELRHFHGLGVAGVSSYSEPADWWTYELQHYLLAKMSFDVATSLDGLLRDYFEHRYGPAAGEIAEIVRLLEAFLPQAARIPGSSLSRSVPPSTLYAFMRPSENLLRGYERLVARCRSLLERASARAGLSEQVRERLARWAVLVDYVELEVQARGFALAMSDMPSSGFLEGYVEATRKMASLARANSANGLVLHPRWAEYDRDIAAAFSCAREETP
jgi:hypothetical protein